MDNQLAAGCTGMGSILEPVEHGGAYERTHSGEMAVIEVTMQYQAAMEENDRHHRTGHGTEREISRNSDNSRDVHGRMETKCWYRLE